MKNNLDIIMDEIIEFLWDVCNFCRDNDIKEYG